MKTRILRITGIITGVSIIIAVFFGYRYYHGYNIRKEYSLVDALIVDIKTERRKVKQKIKQLEEVKSHNHEKTSLLDLWQKEKEKVEKK